MKRDDEIRDLLRGADPAEGRELAHVDRVTLRRAVLGAAAQGAPRRSLLPTLAFGGALATIVLALLALMPRPERLPAASAVPLAVEAPAPVVTDPPPRPEPQPRPRRARPSIRLAREEEPARTTRIVFTGPDGTRILWFVGTPGEKELGS